MSPKLRTLQPSNGILLSIEKQNRVLLIDQTAGQTLPAAVKKFIRTNMYISFLEKVKIPFMHGTMTDTSICFSVHKQSSDTYTTSYV